MLPVDEIADTLASMKAATSIDVLQRHFSQAIMKLGFPYFAYMRWAKNDIELEQSIYTYPDAWISHYFKQDYHRIDPIFERSFTSPQPFFWSGSNFNSNIMIQNFFKEAQDYGIHHGITTPLRTAAQRRAMLTVAAPKSSFSEEKQIPMCLSICQVLANSFHQSAMSISNSFDIRLSPRQKDVLTLASHGLTTRDISSVLGLTEPYICEVVSEILQKLGTTSRISAVRRALELGLIK